MIQRYAKQVYTIVCISLIGRPSSLNEEAPAFRQGFNNMDRCEPYFKVNFDSDTLAPAS